MLALQGSPVGRWFEKLRACPRPSGAVYDTAARLKAVALKADFNATFGGLLPTRKCDSHVDVFIEYRERQRRERERDACSERVRWTQRKRERARESARERETNR